MSLHLSSAPRHSSYVGALIAQEGYAFVPAGEMTAELEAKGLRDWNGFAASWDDLGLDRYMADGGLYRRRRHAVFEICGKDIKRLLHQPHFQALSHNPLNGGVARWFEPIQPEIGRHPAFLSVLTLCNDAFTAQSHFQNPKWRVEAHQFRIEASASGGMGKPTPEGVHRDGVDWVFVMLVRRENISGGETIIEDETGRLIQRQSLSNPHEAIFLDDLRVRHGVTDVHAGAKGGPTFRDVLVLTFKKR
jgi:hypothetical protein